jgi:isopentenyl-diphosphate delta-isomerase
MTTQKRKEDHIKICLEEDVERGNTGFEDVILIHNSLPDMNFKDVDTSIEFLEKDYRCLYL